MLHIHICIYMLYMILFNIITLFLQDKVIFKQSAHITKEHTDLNICAKGVIDKKDILNAKTIDYI